MHATSTPLRAETTSPPERRSIPWEIVAWYLLLLVAVFFPVLKPMVLEWYDQEEMGHAFFVPVIALYIVWKQQDTLVQTPVKPFWPALALVVWGFCQMLLGFIGADFFIARTAFLFAVVGVVWTLLGTAMLKQLWFPLLLLVFMIRIPLLIYTQITFPLQIFASQVAEVSLNAIGIPTLRDGNILELPSQRLSVVEACSGIRSLLSLTFLSLVYGYFFDSKVWMRFVLLVTTIPIAIVANASRVTLTGVLSEYDPELAKGAFHTFEGWIIFMVALLGMILVHGIANKIYHRVKGART